MAAVAKAAKGVADSSAPDSAEAGGIMSFSDKGLCPDLTVPQVRYSPRRGFVARAPGCSLAAEAPETHRAPETRAVCPSTSPLARPLQSPAG